MRCRGDYRDLSTAEKSRFIAALYDAKSRGVVDAFADEHEIHFNHGHRNSSFLPWHREFLRRFEAELQVYDPRVMLCYWNSSDDQATSAALWDPAFLGQFDGAWSLGRTLGTGGSLAAPDTVVEVLDLDTYDVFWVDLESRVHNGPHGWVGGEMATAASPHDPVFFLHHTYIDMLWAQWQLRNPSEPFVPSAGAPDVGDHMHPWPTTVGDVLDHRAINLYSYPAGYIEDAPRVTPPPAMPPAATFPAVPAGMTFLAAALFQLDACENLTFNIGTPVVDSGPPGTIFSRLDPSIVVDPHVEPVGRVWLSYTGTTAGDHATGHVDVACVETGEAWVVPIVADVIALPKSAIALVLDQSNSMNFDSGIAPGVPRSAVLRFSAPPCLQVLDESHAAMVISFDHDAHLQRGLTVADATGRLQLGSTISAYSPNPQGWTAIGEAVNLAHGQLDPITGYDVKATVILTDGKENHGPHDRLAIADVAGLINERVFAIGLGTPANLEPAALQALCNGNNGYMLITGDLNTDAYFRLAKYYQQIIAGVTNQEIVLDPDGVVYPGQIVRIPFHLTEADITARAVLLTDNPSAMIFGIETPGGQIIAPSTAHPMVEFRTAQAVEMYRVAMPLALGAEQAHEGTWTALLGVSGKYHGMAVHALAATGAAAARYSLSIHALSNLRMRATLSQSGNEPGATVHLSAALTEYAMPLSAPARVRAEIVRPDGSQTVLPLAATGPGAYQASMTATQAGVWRFRIIAQGTTMRGRRFTREQTLTGAVWPGGDRPPSDPRDPDRGFCHLLHCLLADKGVVEWLNRQGIDPTQIAKCLDQACSEAPTPGNEAARIKALLGSDGALDVLRRMVMPH